MCHLWSPDQQVRDYARDVRIHNANPGNVNLLQGLKARMLVAEQKNESLEWELAALGNEQVQQASFGGSIFGRPAPIVEEEDLDTPLSPNLVIDVKDMDLHLKSNLHTFHM
jgi:hypothetical protein